MSTGVKQVSASRRRRSGLSLIEVLVSLAITAALLVAVGMAYTASAQAIEMNDQFYRATQAARVSINQIVAEVRRSISAVVSGAGDEMILTTTVKETGQGEELDYKYDPATKKLTVTVTVTGVLPVTYTMARNVASVRFDTGSNLAGDVTNISVTMSVESGSSQIQLNGSTMLRRELSYQ